MKESWVIIKKMEVNNKELNIILLDNAEEVMEFDSYDKAKEMADIFERNSDSGWSYTPRKVGER